MDKQNQHHSESLELGSSPETYSHQNLHLKKALGYLTPHSRLRSTGLENLIPEPGNMTRTVNAGLSTAAKRYKPPELRWTNERWQRHQAEHSTELPTLTLNLQTATWKKLKGRINVKAR